MIPSVVTILSATLNVIIVIEMQPRCSAGEIGDVSVDQSPNSFSLSQMFLAKRMGRGFIFYAFPDATEEVAQIVAPWRILDEFLVSTDGRQFRAAQNKV